MRTFILKGKFPRLLWTALFLLTTMLSQAQESTVTGTVTDDQGQPIIGAGVVIEGTSRGVTTDAQGKFSLPNVPASASLTVEYLGYVSQTIPVAGQGVVNFTLLEDTQLIDEVVVIGYGSVKRSSLTSAVSKMDAEGIQDRPLARPEAALQGQLAGVSVRTQSGEPGEDLQIRVRGAASINAKSDPLYVVDGIPLTTLSGVNPSDIESIEVLKDAASAAIYGSRGSNGVVIVTTKRGRNTKPTVSFRASFGIQSPEKKLDVLSATEWMEIRTRFNDRTYLNRAKDLNVSGASITDPNAVRLANLGLASNDYNVILDPRWFNYMSEATRAAHAGQYNPTSEGLSLLDYQDAFFRDAIVQEYNLSVTGGNDNTSYLFSGGYFDQEGIAVGTNYKRFTFRTNIESKINKYITIGMNLAPTYTIREGAGLANGKDSRIHHVLSSVPVSEPGVGHMTNVDPNPRYDWAGSPSSPIAYMQTDIRDTKDIRMVGSAFLRVTPLEGLQIQFDASANYFDRDYATYHFSSVDGNWSQGPGANSSGGHETQRSWGTMLQGVVNYDKTFGKHTIGVMAAGSVEESNVGFDTAQAFGKPFPHDYIPYSFDESTHTAGNSSVTQRTPNRLASVLGRVSYNYDDRYMISGSLRYDGGSIFGMNRKWGAFPAISAGWMVSNENFFKNLGWSWFNTLKLRASYGVTGNNAINATAAYPTLAGVNYGGNVGYNANSLGNPELGWEMAHSTDLAIDLGLFRNRVQLSVDWYTKTTKDLLYEVPVTGASGFSKAWMNAGELANQGFEVELNTANLIGAFKWNTSFNLSYNKNEVKQIGINDTPVYSGFDGNNPSNALIVGRPINEFYLFEAIGVWKSQEEIDAFAAAHGNKAPTFNGTLIKPGDIRYRDRDNNGQFETTSTDPNTDGKGDRMFLGNPTATFVYGMTNNFTYKNFDLSILLTAQTGGKILGVFGRAIDRPSMGANTNMMDRWMNAWWSEDEPGDGTVPYLLSSTTGGTVDSRWLYSSNYLRIKNVTLGYQIPINRNIFSSARAYISIENLYKWDNYYNGFSPESSNAGGSGNPGGSNSLGLDYGGYPMPRIFTLGLNLTF